MAKVCFSYIFGLHTRFLGPLQDGKEGPVPHLSLVVRQTPELRCDEWTGLLGSRCGAFREQSELVLPVPWALHEAASKAEVLGQLPINTLLNVMSQKYHFSMLFLSNVYFHTQWIPIKPAKLPQFFYFKKDQLPITGRGYAWQVLML